MGSITINGNVINLDKINTGFLDWEQPPKFMILKTEVALDDAAKSMLDSKGISIEDYLDDNAYLCYNPRAQAPDLGMLRVIYLGPYVRDWKIHANLRAENPDIGFNSGSGMDEPAPPEKVRVTVLVHKSANGKGSELGQDLRDKNLVEDEECDCFSDRVVATIHPSSLSNIADIENVKVIEKNPELGFFNNICRDVVNDSIYINDIEKCGAGQVIGVADSGFDLGKTNDVHEAFKDRVLALYQVGLKESNLVFQDNLGHGTHVSGTALGDGRLDKMASGCKKIRGTAPEAQLVLTRMLDSSGVFYDGPLERVFGEPYTKHNACIQNCSWGARFRGTQLHYNIGAGDIDSFISKNPEVLICFAAGNDGKSTASPAQIGAQASAKNCITVGACHSARRSNDSAGYDPNKTFDDSPAQIAALSSRGPTISGRIKPDIVAPGIAVLSAATRSKPSNDFTFGTSTDQAWAFMSGTSMASPVVAGCAAVLRQVIQEIYPSNPTAGADPATKFPSAALLKALLVNGAVPLKSTLRVPNGEQGFGRVNVEASVMSISDPKQPCFRDGLTLRMGETSQAIEIQIPEVKTLVVTTDKILSQLKVTLTWTDAVVGDKLSSILHLTVKFKGNGVDEERHGNMAPGDAAFDNLNNVQQVDWVDLSGGTATILVNCTLTTIKTVQPYSIAWSLN